MTPIDHHKALARRLYEDVFGRGNLDAAAEILAADSVSHGPGVLPPSAPPTSRRKPCCCAARCPICARS